MSFDNLKFNTVVTERGFGEKYFTLKQHGGAIRLTLNVGAVILVNSMLEDYNAIDLLVSDDNVFAIKPKTKPKSKNNKVFTVTGLSGKIKNIPFNRRLPVVIYKDMIVCDLRHTKTL